MARSLDWTPAEVQRFVDGARPVFAELRAQMAALRNQADRESAAQREPENTEAAHQYPLFREPGDTTRR